MSELGKRLFGERSINWIALVLVVLVLGSGAAGVAWLYRKQLGQQTDAIRSQILLAEKGKDVEQLEQLYDRLLRFSPRDAETLEKYGNLLLKKAKTNRQKAQALKIFDRAVRENQSNVPLRQSLVELAFLPGFDDICNPDPHLEILKAELPASAEPCERLAFRAEERGDFAAAEKLARDGLKRDPKHLPTRLRLARLLQFRLKREKEADVLVKEIDLTQLASADQLAMAEYLSEVGDFKQQQEILEGALKAFPNDPNVLLAAATSIEERAGKTTPPSKDLMKRAGDLLQKGLSIAPTRQDFYVRLAYLDLRENRFDDAKEIVKRGLAAVPSSFELRWAKCQIAFAEPNSSLEFKEVESAIKEIREIDPRQQVVQFLDARLAFARKRWVEAVQGFERVVPMLARDKSLSRQALLMLGAAYRELDEPVLREMAYRRILALESLNVDAYLGIGESLADQGRYSDAISQLGQVLGQVPKPDRPRLVKTMLVSLVRQEIGKDPKLRRWQEVDKLLAEVDKESPGNQLILDLQVERLAAEGKFDEAVRVVDRFIQRQLKSADSQAESNRQAIADAYKTKVLLLLQKGDETTAKTVLSQGLKESGDTISLRLAQAAVECLRGLPKDLRPLDKLSSGVDKFSGRERLLLWRALASIRQSRGDEAGALELYTQVSVSNPEDQGTQRKRFLLALDLGDLKKADEAAAALARSNASAGSPAMCAKVLLELNGYERNPNPSSLRQHEVNLLGFEKHYRSWDGVPRAIARIADLENKPKEAITHYEAAYDPRMPNFRIARRLLQLNNQLANFDESRKWLGRSRIDSGDTQTLRAAAEVLVRSGDFANAKTLISRVAPPDTRDLDLAIWGGAILQAARSPVEAERLLRRAIEIGPEQSRSLVALVDMLVRQGRKDEARMELGASTKRLAALQLPTAQARCEELLGDNVAARRYVEQAIRLNPKDFATLRAASEFYLRNLDFPEVLSTAAKLKRESASDPEQAAWAARMTSVALIAMGRTEEAKTSLLEIGSGGVTRDGSAEVKLDLRTRAVILALQPSSMSWRDALRELAKLESFGISEPTDHLIAAQLEERLGDWRDAKTRLTSLAKQTNYRNPEVLTTLVRGMIANDEPSVTVNASLSRLESLKPDDVETVYLRAQLLAKKGRNDAAEFIVRQVADQKLTALIAAKMLAELDFDAEAINLLAKTAGDVSKPGPPLQLEASVELMRLLARSGKMRDALNLCSTLRSQFTPPVYAQLFLGLIHSTSSNLPAEPVTEFHEWLNRQIRTNPKDYTLRLAASGLESRLGRHANAIEILKKLRADLPASDALFPAVVNNLAFLTAFAEKNFEVAERMLVEQVAASPSQVELRDTLGIVYLEQGKIDQAISEFQELTFLSPKGVTYFHLAQAQAKKGSLEAARTSLEKARRLKIRPDELHEFERSQYNRLTSDLKPAKSISSSQ